MKTAIKVIEGPQINIDLSDVTMIEMYGQRDSEAGWVHVKLTIRSGAVVSTKMTPASYDQLLIDWEDKPKEVKVVAAKTKT